jgi:hypothetical protein
MTRKKTTSTKTKAAVATKKAPAVKTARPTRKATKQPVQEYDTDATSNSSASDHDAYANNKKKSTVVIAKPKVARKKVSSVVKQQRQKDARDFAATLPAPHSFSDMEETNDDWRVTTVIDY